MNTRRIESKLREFAALPGLTTQQAEQLSDLLKIIEENETNQPFVMEWRSGTVVDTGIPVGGVTLSAVDIVALDNRDLKAQEASKEKRAKVGNIIIASAATLTVTALTGGTGSAIAGSALSALKAIQTTR